MEEVSGPVIAIALVLAAVFLPSLLLPGLTGPLFQPFAVTIAISMLISAFNAQMCIRDRAGTGHPGSDAPHPVRRGRDQPSPTGGNDV